MVKNSIWLKTRDIVRLVAKTLYEMFSEKRAFEGQSAASVIAAVLEREPAPLEIAPATGASHPNQPGKRPRPSIPDCGGSETRFELGRRRSSDPHEARDSPPLDRRNRGARC